MSKKIYFGKINEETVGLLNELSEVLFVSSVEMRRLTIDGKAAKAAYEKAKNDGKESTVEELNAVNSVQYKRNALNAWKKKAFFGDKDNTSDIGVMSKLGITAELHTAYVVMQTEGKRGAYLDAIKKVLSALGMDNSENLTKLLANKLQFVVGNKVATSSAIVQGKLTKQEGYSTFAQIFALSMLEYIAETCEKVTIYKSELYNVSVAYDEHVKFEKYEITEKEADK